MRAYPWTNLLASLVIGASLVLSSWMIQQGVKAKPSAPVGHEAVSAANGSERNQNDKFLLSVSEAAIYLNMTEDQIKTIIATEASQLSHAGSYQGVMFPYIQVNNEVLISKNDLVRWLADASASRRSYGIHG
ncbi:hypothetical protein [Cohnella nanjingensis]|uniref:Uncharacterized protein n=1 Tax=Cohnella nanjingensis TaxID=1387779 RepID=A0A7X0VGW7_9BACL|nr:hypothetical protein [Cohnella nanjingensis]MBB6672818.1 hypothetical protein [Cohnella nanjingensis]